MSIKINGSNVLIKDEVNFIKQNKSPNLSVIKKELTKLGYNLTKTEILQMSGANNTNLDLNQLKAKYGY